MPSNGAPINSSDDDSSRLRPDGLLYRLAPFCPGGAFSSWGARIGDGPLIRRSSDELEEL